MASPPLAAARSPAEIARASGSNFLTSFLFLSPGRRRALLAVYAFCRVVDDAVDAIDEDGAATDERRVEARRQLDFWREELDAAFAGRPQTPTGFALHRAAERFDLDPAPLHDVCNGCEMDLEARSYVTFAALEVYMRRVASAVGIACLPIFGADPERSRAYADKLGIALQYTNILRDVAEDGARGRLYLPLDTLEAHGVDRSTLVPAPPPASLTPGGPIARMLVAEHQRAKSLYAEADAVLPDADRSALRPARIMANIYSDLQGRVEKLGPDVLTAPRCRVPLVRKLYLATFGL
ncbi:MAG: squalene/phytoene synthase family protein [Planctomycetes bacterium]|nr:squalene/phytoene synthase family protein [Planctomycetota bacterium]